MSVKCAIHGKERDRSHGKRGELLADNTSFLNYRRIVYICNKVQNKGAFLLEEHDVET